MSYYITLQFIILNRDRLFTTTLHFCVPYTPPRVCAAIPDGNSVTSDVTMRSRDHHIVGNDTSRGGHVTISHCCQ